MLNSPPLQKRNNTSARVPKNRILAALPEYEWRRLEPHFKYGALSVGTVLFNESADIERVYFLDEGMISFVLVSRDGMAVEVGVAGHEGVVGAEAASKSKAGARAIVQIPAVGWQLPANIFAEAATGGTRLQELLLEYWQFVAAQNAQLALCNRLHTIEQRLCRWLLLVHGHMDADELALTQRFLADMLGVKRSGVSLTAASLRSAGLIDYRHGHIALLDIPALEARSCECHAALQKRFHELIK